MKITELIEQLTEILNTKGNLDVVSQDVSNECNSFVNFVEYSKNPNNDYYCQGDSVTNKKSCVLLCDSCKWITFGETIKNLSNKTFLKKWGLNYKEDDMFELYISYKDNHVEKIKLSFKELLELNKYSDFIVIGSYYCSKSFSLKEK